ncbi:MAG TPA: hypothetical protein EYP17_04695, partial [Candidatus Latescibacteria bacterium]|nr:hypothetical protein [Candidatus Latescibacterota bacterium]
VGDEPPIELEGLELALQADRAAYEPGEPVTLTFVITNTGGTALHFTFSSSKRFDILVERDGILIWQWSHGRKFLQVIDELILEPGDSLTYELTWPQVDNTGNPVPPGEYEVSAAFEPEGYRLESPHLMIRVKEAPLEGHEAVKELDGLKLVLWTEKESYPAGEPVPLKFEVINIGSIAAHFIFSSSRRFDLLVKQDGRVIWQWSRGKYFLQVFTEVVLKPGESLAFGARWPQVDSAGNSVPPGSYEVLALLTAAEPVESAPLMIEVGD